MSRKRKILVVDDEQDILLYLSTLFEDNGFDTVTAENGIQALEQAKSEMPDLITLDITMPEQSGIKTYRHLKNDVKLRNIPVIIITAVGDPIKSVLNEFAEFPHPEGFINKPIDQKELISAASDILS
ncbi:MAG: response regulator [Proteobacteria bacterium]|nr:response regulator [Pseudomonadota bacterium]